MTRLAEKPSNPGFIVLSDKDVNTLLGTLGKDEIVSLAEVLKGAFHSYSIGNENQYQLHRSGITRPNGQATLLMPASLPTGSSVKVLGVPPPGSNKPLRGALVLLNDAGRCTGIINSEEFTGFRTSLGAMLLFIPRRNVSKIIMFGAGKQGYWHLRLSLTLRSSEISKITIYDPSLERARQLVEQLLQLDLPGISDSRIKINILEGSSPQEVHDSTRAAVGDADVIFCATPSKMPLFPAEWIYDRRERNKLPYISAIGSYRLDMGELDMDLLRSFATTAAGAYHPYYGKNISGGLVVIDSREACALEAGEIVRSRIEGTNLPEFGEVVDLERNGADQAKSELQNWLQDGPVIYKSVGLGIMDLSLGQALLEHAASAGIGSLLGEF